jgi:putative restriction endonuclease
MQVSLASLPSSEQTAIAETLPVTERYGAPILVAPRLGQGTFRAKVIDAYERRCVVANERTLPVLEASHIKPYSLSGPHAPENGLLLRSDLHTLFDRGYVTVTPDRIVRVSRRIRDEFENGRDYYAIEGRQVRLPAKENPPPSREYLEWHADTLFKG